MWKGTFSDVAAHVSIDNADHGKLGVLMLEIIPGYAVMDQLTITTIYITKTCGYLWQDYTVNPLYTDTRYN